MRVNPILDWSYAHVWAFLRGVGVHYCSLYDLGFTSLGAVHNTAPNPKLALGDGRFAPAYMLTDDASERDGRGKPLQPPACDET